MATVKSVERLAQTSSAVVTFSNGYQLGVRIVDEHDGRYIIITPTNKLVAINNDMSCKVLAEGVSIR